MEENTKPLFLQRPAAVSLLALLCCALWGTAFPCIKIGYGLLNIDGAGGQLLFGGLRFMLAGIFTLAFACLTRPKSIRVQKSSVPMIAGQGLLQTGLQYTFYYIGVAHTTGARGAVINASSTFFAIFIAHFLMKNERITARKLLGCLIGFAGIIIMNLGTDTAGNRFSLLGEGMIFLSSAAYGASSVTMKLISKREDTVAVTAMQFVVGSAVMIIAGLALGGRIGGFSLRAAGLLIYLALLSSVAFVIWGLLLKHNPVSRVTVFGFSIPVFGVSFSALLLGEHVVSLRNLAALVLVCGGIIFVNTAKNSIIQLVDKVLWTLSTSC